MKFDFRRNPNDVCLPSVQSARFLALKTACGNVVFIEIKTAFEKLGENGFHMFPPIRHATIHALAFITINSHMLDL